MLPAIVVVYLLGAVFWGGVAFVQYVEPSVSVLVHRHGTAKVGKDVCTSMLPWRLLEFSACAVLLPIVRRLWRSAFKWNYGSKMCVHHLLQPPSQRSRASSLPEFEICPLRSKRPPYRPVRVALHCRRGAWRE